LFCNQIFTPVKNSEFLDVFVFYFFILYFCFVSHLGKTEFIFKNAFKAFVVVVFFINSRLDWNHVV